MRWQEAPISLEVVSNGLFCHRDYLLRVARRYAYDIHDADDVVQESLEIALQRLGSFEPGTNVRAWLAAILFNVMRNHARKRGRMQFADIDTDALAGMIASSSDSATEAVLTFLLERKSESLSPDQRVTLLLLSLGLTYADIAAFLDMPIGTVRSRISRARARLKSAEDRF